MMQQKGRSMVEMLGVLAIIGVLSATALAGYSKAMKQHRLNVHQEQMNNILNGITIYGNTFAKMSEGRTENLNLNRPLYSLGYVDKRMLQTQNWNTYGAGFFRDIYNNQLTIQVTQAGVVRMVYYFRTKSMDACINTYQLMKAREELFKSISLNSKVYYHKCKEETLCMKDITNAEIYEHCEKMLERIEASSSVYVYFNFNSNDY